MTEKVGIVLEGDPNEKLLRFMWAQYKELQEQSRLLKDFSTPVDEYEFNKDPFPGPVNIAAAFSSTVRIESITALLPVGITSAILQLGERYLPLYSGDATAVITQVNFTDMGIILSGNDNRVLTFAGPPTSGYYIGLSGHALKDRH